MHWLKIFVSDSGLVHCFVLCGALSSFYPDYYHGPAVLTLMVFKLLLYLSSPNLASKFAVLFLT